MPEPGLSDVCGARKDWGPDALSETECSFPKYRRKSPAKSSGPSGRYVRPVDIKGPRPVPVNADGRSSVGNMGHRYRCVSLESASRKKRWLAQLRAATWTPPKQRKSCQRTADGGAPVLRPAGLGLGSTQGPGTPVGDAQQPVLEPQRLKP